MVRRRAALAHSHCALAQRRAARLFARMVASVLLLGLVLGQSGTSTVTYAPQSATQHVWFFCFKGDASAEALGARLRELDCALLVGPEHGPSRAFIAVSVPAQHNAKAALKIVRKAGVKPEPLEWIAFDGRDDHGTTLPSLGPGFTQRDHILGMDGGVRWFDSQGGYTQFYCVPGKVSAEQLASSWTKLFAGFGGGTLGAVVQHDLSWKLTPAADAKLAKKVCKSLRKLDLVSDASIDADGGRLHVRFTLDGALTCDLPSGTTTAGQLRARVAVNELLGVLAGFELTPAL